MAGTQNQIGLQSAYGYIWMNTGNWTGAPFSLTTSYQELSGLSTVYTLSPAAQYFSMTTDGRLKYTGAESKDFVVDAQYANSASLSGAMKLYKNGAPLNDSEVYQVSFRRCMLAGFFVTLSANDYLSIWCRASSAVSSAITQISLSATFLAGM